MKKVQKLAGFQDIMPNAALVKEQAIFSLINTFKLFGFLPIQTPHIEYAEILVDPSDTEGQKQIYQFKDQGGRDIALRFDHTVPLARFISEYKYDLALPFKRYAIGEVFRGESPQAGRFREFTQCDFDIIGIDSNLAELEICQLIVSCLQSLNLKDFVVLVNHRKLLDAVLDSLDIAVDKRIGLLQISDKIAKIGQAEVKEQLLKKTGLSAAQADKWLQVINTEISSFNDLKNLFSAQIKNSEKIEPILSEIKVFFGFIKTLGLENFIKWDLKIVRGLLYYTGLVFESYIKSNLSLGAICSGGRYDNLTAKISGESIAGVGASIGLDRLLSSLVENNATTATKKSILAVPIDEAAINYTFNLISKLRNEGIQAVFYPEVLKLKKQFSYAEKLKINYLVAVGPDEVKNDSYTIVELANSKRHSLHGLDSIIKFLNGK